MIAQRAFEAFIDRQLAGDDRLSLHCGTLHAQGWDVQTLQELVREYAQVPAEERRFAVQISLAGSGDVLEFTRLPEVAPISAAQFPGRGPLRRVG